MVHCTDLECSDIATNDVNYPNIMNKCNVSLETLTFYHKTSSHFHTVFVVFSKFSLYKSIHGVTISFRFCSMNVSTSAHVVAVPRFSIDGLRRCEKKLFGVPFKRVRAKKKKEGAENIRSTNVEKRKGDVGMFY